MGDIEWSFAPSNGGRDFGINDPGVETFRGNFSHYLARELIQNSMDARLDWNKPVRVSFALEEIGRSELPDFAGLVRAIARCKEYWHTQQKTVKLLDKALAALEGRKIRCLRVSDYNTHGVAGSDGDRKGDWYNLVRCAGSSAKAHGEGGSFGIGKNAPFAASLARTVLYSTRTSRSDVAFQGVALLATHDDADGLTLQPSGFLGLSDAGAVRDSGRIPKRFARDQMGTDIWIIGYPDAADWRDDLMFSVLDSFWPAIQFGDLVVEIGGVPVSKVNLDRHLSEYSAKEGFTGHMYYEAYASPQVFTPTDLPEIGECALYLNSSEESSTKRVAMIRKTGMIITKRQFRATVPFTGVFICRNDVGNARLREMEPPRHDEWSPDYPEKGASRRIYESIGSAIRGQLKNLMPTFDAQSMAIPGLERFLPDIDSDSATTLWGGDGATNEGAHGSVIESAQLKPISMRKSSLPVFEAGPGPSGSEDEDEDVGPSVGERSHPEENDNAAQRDAGPSAGGDEGRAPREPVPIGYRTFSVDPSLGKYVATVHPRRGAAAAIISAYAVGEDQKAHIPIATARLSNGDILPIQHGSIGPITLDVSSAMKIEFVAAEPGRYALELTANEA